MQQDDNQNGSLYFIIDRIVSYYDFGCLEFDKDIGFFRSCGIWKNCLKSIYTNCNWQDDVLEYSKILNENASNKFYTLLISSVDIADIVKNLVENIFLYDPTSKLYKLDGHRDRRYVYSLHRLNAALSILTDQGYDLKLSKEELLLFIENCRKN